MRQFISNASASEVIQIQNLKLEVLSTLSLFQVKYLQLMYLLSTKAVNLISEYVDNFPRKENTNLEPDNAHDDHSNDDDDDDDDDKDNSDMDDDADNDDNGDDDNNGNGDDDNDDDY